MKKGLYSILLCVCLAFTTLVVTSRAATTIQVNTLAQLQDWVLNQAEGDVVEISGEIGLEPMAGLTVENQTGWFLPITVNNVTIKGVTSNATLFGNSYVKNGAWASQSLIAVFGDNVTIENLTIMPKVEVNKSLEVCGSDFTVKGCTFAPNTLASDFGTEDPDEVKKDGSALYFNGGVTDMGDVSIEGNSFFDACIAFDSYKDAGTTTISNNEFTIVNNTGYTIGNVSWAPTPVTTTAPINIVGNTIKEAPADYNCFIQNRMEGTITIVDTKCPAGFDITKSIKFDNRYVSYEQLSVKSVVEVVNDGVKSTIAPKADGTTTKSVVWDKTNLTAAINSAEQKIASGNYTTESVAALNLALTSAKSVAAKEVTTQAEIDEVLSALNKAVDNLVQKPSESVSSVVKTEKEKVNPPTGSQIPLLPLLALILLLGTALCLSRLKKSRRAGSR